MHKQLPQIAVAALADAEESGLATGRVLARHKSQPGCRFSFTFSTILLIAEGLRYS